MPQHFLDPTAIPADAGLGKAPDELPPAVRTLGHIPDLELLWPGDLILVCPAHPSKFTKPVSAAIRKFQEAGGFAAEDARWHHAAVYLGTGFDVVEAGVSDGVHLGSLLDYVPAHLIRVRRAPRSTREDGWMLAVNAMKLLGHEYSLETIRGFAGQALRGFWRPDSRRAVHHGVVCSIVYTDAYAATFEGRVPATPAIPAKLSASDRLHDVPLAWKRIQ